MEQASKSDQVITTWLGLRVVQSTKDCDNFAYYWIYLSLIPLFVIALIIIAYDSLKIALKGCSVFRS